MKKLLTYIFLALSLVTLAACGKNEAAKLTSSTNNHQSKVQGQVTLILKTDKESKKKSVEIQKGDTVLDVLEEVYPVQENDGFITEIDGISQDKEQKLSEIIEEINSRTGKAYNKDVAVKAMLQITDILEKNEQLKESAKNNSSKEFETTYYDNIDDALIEGLNQNEDFFTLLLNHPEMKKEVMGIFIEELYKRLRNEK